MLSFDKVIAYYDNGQTEVSRTLNAVLNAFFFEVEFRRVKPHDCRLFQAADLCRTPELLRAKVEDKAFVSLRPVLLPNQADTAEGLPTEDPAETLRPLNLSI